MTYTGQDYGTTPAPAAPPTPDAYGSARPQPSGTARGMAIGGFVCAALALLFLPPVLGIIGAVLGFVAYSKGDRLGLYAGIASIACAVIGMVIGALIVANT